MHVEDITFRALGTDVRLVVTGDDAEQRLRRGQEEIAQYDLRLSRFRDDSELCELNADPREEVPASDLLREAVAAALWAAERTDGLVDPCLLDALEAAGYRDDFQSDGVFEAPLGSPRPVAPDPARRWRQIRVDETTITRPPGLRLDLGGTGKGHVADRVARIFSGAHRWAIDCGGDVRVGGAMQEVLVAHPLRDEIAAGYVLHGGALATSSIVARSWTAGNGRAHHIRDPATGRPVWTGLLAVTARGASTLEAETPAKLALLRGPAGGRAVLLARAGGVLFHGDGRAEEVGT